jgi:hypothetical protein
MIDAASRAGADPARCDVLNSTGTSRNSLPKLRPDTTQSSSGCSENGALSYEMLNMILSYRHTVPRGLEDSTP